MSTTLVGICVECEGAVEPELLNVRPNARICLDCMKEDERRALEEDLQLAQEVNRALLPRRLVRPSGEGTMNASTSRCISQCATFCSMY